MTAVKDPKTLAGQFIAYLTQELNYSPRTTVSYRRVLGEWLDALAADAHLRPEEVDLANVRAADLRAWAVEMAERGLSARTVHWKMSAVRSFYTFLCRHHGFTANPAAEVALAPIPKRLPQFIMESETQAALSEGEVDHSSFTAVRNHLVVAMLYETGMRASEIISLTDSDVDLSRGEVRVLGKRNKERVIPVGDNLARAIREYRRLRTDTVGASATDTFFVRPDGRPMYYQLLNRIVHAALDGHVSSPKRSPHALRHSFATDMLNNGADINAVRQLLGHASLETTQIYTHITYRELQNNYKLAHPRALKD